MSRMIDADEFKNRMYHEAFEKDSDMQKWDSGCWIRYRLFEEVLRGQPTVTPEPHWIPCSERLPEVGETVLFCDYDRDIYVGHRAIEHWWSVDDKVKNVTAWMPLPEHYKG